MGYKVADYTARPLTEEEKIFAKEHHDMIYFYIRNMHLDIEEWYDILIIPYLQAVKKYHLYEPCKKYAFSTVLKMKLKSAVWNELRTRKRYKNRPSGGIYSLNEMMEGDNPFSEFQIDAWWIDKTANVEAYVIEKEFFNDVYNNIEHYEDADLLKLIFLMKNEGYTVLEIAEQVQKDFTTEFDGCSCRDVMRVISKLSNRKSGILQTLVAEIMEQYE